MPDFDPLRRPNRRPRVPLLALLKGHQALRRCAAVDGLPRKRKHLRRLPWFFQDLATGRWWLWGRKAGFDQ